MNMKVTERVVIFSALILMALIERSPAGQQDLTYAVDSVQKIKIYKERNDPRIAVTNKYNASSDNLRALDDKFNKCQKNLAAAEQNHRTALKNYTQLEERIKKLEEKTSFFDIKTNLQISAYKKELENYQKKEGAAGTKKRALQDEEDRLVKERGIAKKDLEQITNQINNEYGGLAELDRAIAGDNSVIQDLERQKDKSIEDMTADEQRQFDEYVSTGKWPKDVPPPWKVSDSKRFDNSKPGFAAKAGPLKPGDKDKEPDSADKDKAGEGDQQVSGGQPSDKKKEAARQEVKKPKPVTPDAPPLGAGGQIIGMSCGTELFSYDEGRQLGKKLRREDLANVTVMRDGKQVDISGEEAIELLIKNGYFTRSSTGEVVATQKYFDYTGESSDSEVASTGSETPSWRKRGRSYPMSQKDAQTYFGGMINGGSSTKSWRDDLQITPMSDKDAAVYGGGMIGGASSREHNTPMSEKDAAVYGGGELGGEKK